MVGKLYCWKLLSSGAYKLWVLHIERVLSITAGQFTSPKCQIREVYLFQWAVGPVETSCILGRNVLQYLHSCKGSSQLHHCTCTTLQNGGVLSGPLAISCAITWALEMFGSKALLTDCILISPPAIQFVLSDEFSHMRPEERQQLLHVRTCMSRLSLTGHTMCHNLHAYVRPPHCTCIVGSVTHKLPKHEVVKF